MRTGLFILSLLVLGACSPLKQYQPPGVPEGLSETVLPEVNNSRLQAVKPVSQWWEQLDDEQLNRIIATSLQNNLDIRIAFTNLLQARAIAREAGFDKYPTITTNASYARQRLSEDASGGNLLDNTRNDYRAGFDGFWTLDLFGRVSQGIAAQEALRDAAIADLQSVYISVAAEVAVAYIQLRGAQYRLSIAERNAKNQQATYDLTTKLAMGGRSTDLDLSRALTQLNLTLATIPQLKAEVTSTIHRLGVLTGRVPASLRSQLDNFRPLPNLPFSVAVGNASDLLKRRPDIRRAERELAATVAEYNVVASDLFPRVNIIGSIGFIATSLASFGVGSTVSGDIGPFISWPAFDLGRVRARIDQADTRSQRALALYERTVLQALEQTQTALNNFAHEEQRRELLRNAALSSGEAAELARQRFEAGIDTFLDVLDAERTQLEAEDALAVSEINTALDLISIYENLGGGWEIKKAN